MRSSCSPSAPREATALDAFPAPATAPDDDQTAWLVTLSDLVLQLFAFVVVGAIAGAVVRGGVPLETAASQDARANAPAAAPLRGAEPAASAAPAAEPAAPSYPAALASGSAAVEAPRSAARKSGQAEPAAALGAAMAQAEQTPAAAQHEVRRPPGEALLASAPAEAAQPEAAASRTAAVLLAARESEEPGAPLASPSAAMPARTMAQVEGEPRVEDRRLAAIAAYLETLLATSQAGPEATLASGAGEIVVSLRRLSGFSPGRADLPATWRPILDEVGRLAAELPDLLVEVAGHTDDRPIRSATYPTNLELSLARAARVARELTSAAPEIGSRTVASGFGDRMPVASNADPGGRELNRRVEIRLRVKS